MTRGLYPSVTCVLLLAGIVGCAGDQRSGAAPAADTGGVSSGDSASAVVGDTGIRAPTDTGSRAATDSATPKADTSTAVATQPAPRKPPRQRAAPKPAADTTAAVRPAESPGPAQTAPSDSANTVRPTPDTTSTPSADTSSSSASQATATAPLLDEYHRAPLDTVSQQVYDGWKQYNLNCARCHGEDVQGTTIAPHLLVSVKPDGPINTKQAFIQVVCAGRPEKGMPSWCALGMEMPKIEAIYSYVKGRSDAKLRPGRPALRAGG